MNIKKQTKKEKIEKIISELNGSTYSDNQEWVIDLRKKLEQLVDEVERNIINKLPEIECQSSDIVLMSDPARYQCIHCNNTWTKGEVIDHGFPICKYRDKLKS